MKFLKNKKLRYFLIALGLLIAWFYRPCYYDGCYGPFEIMIKAENGERVEDIFVRLSHITVGFMGKSTHTYKEIRLGNTNEVIRFPRGYVYDSDSEELIFHFGVQHPDYESRELYAMFPNQDGAIHLGEKIFFRKQDLHDRSIARDIDNYRNEGRSEEEIERKLEGKRIYWPNFAPTYFGRLLSMGRQDLVDKYLPHRLNEFNKLKLLNAREAAKLEDKIMKSIRKYCRRYSKQPSIVFHCR